MYLLSQNIPGVYFGEGCIFDCYTGWNLDAVVLRIHSGCLGLLWNPESYEIFKFPCVCFTADTESISITIANENSFSAFSYKLAVCRASYTMDRCYMGGIITSLPEQNVGLVDTNLLRQKLNYYHTTPHQPLTTHKLEKNVSGPKLPHPTIAMG